MPFVRQKLPWATFILGTEQNNKWTHKGKRKRKEKETHGQFMAICRLAQWIRILSNPSHEVSLLPLANTYPNSLHQVNMKRRPIAGNQEVELKSFSIKVYRASQGIKQQSEAQDRAGGLKHILPKQEWHIPSVS